MAGKNQRYTVTATTDGAGDAVVYLPSSAAAATSPGGAVNRMVNAVVYTKVDFANGVTFAIVANSTGLAVWSEAAVNASKTVHPTSTAADQAGAATAAQFGPIPLADEVLKITIASGGANKTGTFTLVAS